MDFSIRKRYLEIAKELRKYLESENFRVYKPDLAFTHWYIKARFGLLSALQKIVTDGTGDGGIDAIVYEGQKATVFQMKYEIIPSVGTLKSEDLSEFEKLAKIFRTKGSQSEFTEWLETARQDVRAHYEKLYDSAQRHPELVTFALVTTKHTTLRSKTVQIEDIKRVLSLWDLYREGFTPPTDSIELVLDKPFNVDSVNDGFTTYVGLADVRDFVKLMRDDSNERLFAQNVRTDRASSINKEIMETYEDEPESFWLGNNGVYIVCKEVNSSGKHFTLIYPSIINGSQTLHSIKKSKQDHECKILVRILEMDVLNKQQLLADVIRRTNTQNPMKPVNLLAHDPFQLHIAGYLDRYRVFYERREGEWKNEKKNVMSGYLTLTVQELAQWLSTLDSSIGMGLARSRTSNLFLDGNKRKIFGGFDSNHSSAAYSDLIYIVWSGLFIKELIKDVPAAKRSFVKIPHLLLVKGLYEAISSNADLRNGIKELLVAHKIGKRKIPSSISSFINSKIIKELKARQKNYQRLNPTTDYSNYFKVNEVTGSAYSAVFSASRIKQLSKILQSDLKKIV